MLLIFLSSRAHLRWSNNPLDLSGVTTETKDTYDGWVAYGRSKLINILFTRSLAQRFPFAESKVGFYSLHPGLVDTGLLSVAPGLSSQAIPISEGIKGAMYLSTSPEVAETSDDYYHDMQVARDPSVISGPAQSMEDAERLWQESLKMVGLNDAEYGR